jgi:hypothetical protein
MPRDRHWKVLGLTYQRNLTGIKPKARSCTLGTSLSLRLGELTSHWQYQQRVRWFGVLWARSTSTAALERSIR